MPNSTRDNNKHNKHQKSKNKTMSLKINVSSNQKCNTNLIVIIPNTCILSSVNNHSLPFINDYPPKIRSHHPTVDNNNMLLSPRVIHSDKSRKKS